MPLRLLKSNHFSESTCTLAACSNCSFYYIVKIIIFLCCAKCCISIFRSLLWFVSEWNLSEVCKSVTRNSIAVQVFISRHILSVTILAREHSLHILSSWFRASQVYINKSPTWCKLCSLIYFTAESLYMFRVTQHPSSGVLKPVAAASGTGHNIGPATSFQHGQVRSQPGHRRK